MALNNFAEITEGLQLQACVSKYTFKGGREHAHAYLQGHKQQSRGLLSTWRQRLSAYAIWIYGHYRLTLISIGCLLWLVIQTHLRLPEVFRFNFFHFFRFLITWGGWRHSKTVRNIRISDDDWWNHFVTRRQIDLWHDAFFLEAYHHKAACAFEVDYSIQSFGDLRVFRPNRLSLPVSRGSRFIFISRSNCLLAFRNIVLLFSNQSSHYYHAELTFLLSH